MTIKVSDANAPIFKEVTVKSKIPAKLTKLQEISSNLWWVWNDEAIELFRFIDLNLWNECCGNPVLFLERIDSKSLDALEKDQLVIVSSVSLSKRWIFAVSKAMVILSPGRAVLVGLTRALIA